MDVDSLDNAALEPKERAPPKKRRRVVVSCTECHRRKQKCDRELPCANCRSRNKETSCTYETGAPTARAHHEKRKSSPLYQSSDSPQTVPSAPLSSMAATWGYSQTGTSTMGFLKKIESTTSDGDDESPGLAHPASQQENLILREKYKALVRQLPAKVYLDKLIAIYFQKFNWRYAAVDEEIFYRQLQEWNKLPFSILSSTGPHALSPDIRSFPAVLFQIIAIALLSLPESPDPVFDALKYAGNMTFEDLARDYSESGSDIGSLFGKQQLTVTNVLAQFLRAFFLKNTNCVVECWHVISVAIRDAQELGMHRDSLDPRPVDYSIEEVLRNHWLIQRRRKLYMLLVLWDVNMAVVLGRPGCINSRHGLPSAPVDTPVSPKDDTSTPVIPRISGKDPPTALTRLLWWNRLADPLRDIQDLEQEGQYPKDFSKVDRVHEQIMALEDEKPSVLRLVNPDTRWDALEAMHWLPGARNVLAQLHHFSIMALHRPYIFHRKESRTEALKASLEMLELQKRAFEDMDPVGWRDFMMFFGSFDAIVLIASIYVVFPREHEELKHAALRNFHQTVQRFSVMQERNPMAKSAQGVLKAILAKFTKAIGNSSAPSGAETGSEATPSTSTREGTDSNTPSTFGRDTGGRSTVPSIGSLTEPSPTASNSALYPAAEWMPPADNLAGLAPLFPTSDLLFNDLTALQGGDMPPPILDGGPSANLDDLSWQFGGDFGENTMWQLLNQYQPGLV
ncbi:hypothetical protein S40288_01677 [Stachybotrys chartarum IBT 40288]|nr:hypothetical protein S40288_01677 [Stachybotrys chartarum IBT 40288]